MSGSEQAVLSQLARRLAHDINNQLAVVLGRTDSLRMQVAEDPSAEKDLDAIARAVQRASGLAQELLRGARGPSAGGPGALPSVALAPACPMPSESCVRENGAAACPHILVVEDDSAVRTVASRALARVGYSIREASSGEEALALFDSESVALVVTDLAMPGIGGLALADELARRAPNLPVLFATGYAHVVAERAPLPPTRALLAKPYTAQSLAVRVGELLAEGSRR